MADDEKEKKENPFGPPSIELSSCQMDFTFDKPSIPENKPEPSPPSTKSDNDK